MAIRKDKYNGKCPHCNEEVGEWDGSWLPFSLSIEEYGRLKDE